MASYTDDGLYWKGFICLAALFYFWVMRKSRAKLRHQRVIQNGLNQQWEHNRLLQREVYLREELGQIEKQDDRRDILQQHLDNTIQDLWLCKQDLSQLFFDDPNTGILVFRKNLEERKEQCKSSGGLTCSWKEERCKTSGGCCARKCDCCYKPRRTKNDGETTIYYNPVTISYDNYSHCTEDCGCCRRYWGFK